MHVKCGKAIIMVSIDDVARMEKKRDIGAIIAVLKDTNELSWIRSDAAFALGRISDLAALEPLIEVLDENNSTVRAAAARSLGRIGDHRSFWHLVAALNDSDVLVRRYSATSLGEIADERAAPHLKEHLKDDDEEVVTRSAIALGNIGDKNAIPPLLDIIKDSNKKDEIRHDAACSLGMIKKWQVFDLLLELLKDTDSNVRKHTATVFGELNDPRGVQPLIDLLNQEKDVKVRAEAVASLGNIGDYHAVEPLIGILKNLNEDDRVHFNAALALSDIDGSQAIKMLSDLLKNDKDNKRIQKDAALSLSGIGRVEAVEPLTHFLKDFESDFKKIIIERIIDECEFDGDRGVDSLILLLNYPDDETHDLIFEILEEIRWKPGNDELGAFYWIMNEDWDMCVQIGSAATRPLIVALDNDDENVRMAVVESLGKIGDSEASKPLIGALKDDNMEVRSAAAVALRQMDAKIKVRKKIKPVKRLNLDDNRLGQDSS